MRASLDNVPTLRLEPRTREGILPERNEVAASLATEIAAGSEDPPSFSIRGWHGLPFRRPEPAATEVASAADSAEAAIAERVENATEAEIRDIRRRELFEPANLDSGELAILEANPRPNNFRPEHIPDSVRNDETPGLHERIANVTGSEVSALRVQAIVNPASLDSGDLAILAVEAERLREQLENNPANLDSGELLFIRHVIDGVPVTDEVRRELTAAGPIPL